MPMFYRVTKDIKMVKILKFFKIILHLKASRLLYDDAIKASLYIINVHV